MPETVGGIPIHPLVIHAVVVLVPLAAVGVMVVCLVPKWTKTYGTLLLIVTVLGVGAIPLATHTGEQLKASLAAAGLPHNPAIDRHAVLGHTMLFVGPVLLLAAAALWFVGYRLRDNRPLGAGVLLAIRVLAFLAAAAVMVWTIRVGHSGAATIWKGVGAPPSG